MPERPLMVISGCKALRDQDIEVIGGLVVDLMSDLGVPGCTK